MEVDNEFFEIYEEIQICYAQSLDAEYVIGYVWRVEIAQDYCFDYLSITWPELCPTLHVVLKVARSLVCKKQKLVHAFFSIHSFSWWVCTQHALNEILFKDSSKTYIHVKFTSLKYHRPILYTSWTNNIYNVLTTNWWNIRLIIYINGQVR